MSHGAVVIRTVAKIAARSFAAVLAIIIIWFAANRLTDPPPNSTQAAFLVSPKDQVTDDHNVAVGILGLTAPRDSDFIQYGSKVKALYAANAPYGQIQELLRGSKTFRPTVEGGEVNCWLDPDWTSFKACLPFDQAPAILDANKELLGRYKKLYGMDRYVGLDLYYNDAFLVLLRLSVTEMQLDLRNGAHEAAYLKWRDQLRFVKRNLRSTDTWVGKAIGLVALGMTLPVLESLLVAHPDTAKLYAAELYELVRPGGVAAFDPDGIVRAEFALLRKFLTHLRDGDDTWQRDRLHWLAFYLGQKNRIFNRYGAFAREYAVALRLPWRDLEKESERLRDKYFHPTTLEFTLDPFGSLFFADYIEGQLKAREMLRQMHVIDGQQRLATLLVRLINENVRDEDIAQFLANTSPEFRDPFSADPMRWDPKDRKIYFVDPQNKCTVAAWFRLPASHPPHRPSPSTVSTNAC